MSESSKRKSSKLLNFILIYAIFMIAVTAILMYLYSKYNIEINFEKYFSKSETNLENKVDIINSSNIEKIDYSNIERTTLLDKYYFNNIEYTNEKLTYGNIINYYDGEPEYKVTVVYAQINGIKDKTIQRKINEKIKETVMKLVIDNEIYDKDIERIYVTAEITDDCATSDLLSIPVQKNIQYKDGKRKPEDLYEYIYCPSINYRLDTGEELKLEELFTKDANIKNILAQTVYRTLAFPYGFDEEYGDGDFDTVDYGKLENDVYNVILEFNKQEEKNFWFDQRNIAICINNNSYLISTADFSEYINFNNIVKIEDSLYEGGNNPKINYAFGGSFPTYFEYFDKISKNSYLSIFNPFKKLSEEYDPDGQYRVYSENLKNNIEKIVDGIKSDTKKEKNKGYVYNIYSFEKVFYDEFGNDIGPVCLGEKVEIDSENFYENAESIYSLNCRQPTGGDFYYSLINLTYYKKEKFKIYEIILKENPNDSGKFIMGQKLHSYNWEENIDTQYEY